MTTFNSLATKIALAQGIEIGSSEWTEGGLAAFSGQTGGHPAYGWKRPENMTESRCRAVFANYAARGCWYDAAQHPKRHSGYNLGSRPYDWKPEDDYDLPGGERGYLTSSGVVAVSGPDVQHFWIDPLLDIIDRGDGIKVPALGVMMDAPKLAHIMSSFLVDTMAGMIRFHGPYWGGGRTFARVVDTYVQAAKRNTVSKESAEALLDWLAKYGLPALEKAPGVVNAKGVGSFNIYQDLSWVLPALYDLANILKPDQPLLPRVVAVRNRLAQWVLDIDAIKGGRGAWSHCTITEAMKEGVNGAPLPTLIGAVSASDVFGPEWYGSWAVRAADITAHLLPGEQSADYLKRVIAGGGEKKWLVDRNREFLV